MFLRVWIFFLIQSTHLVLADHYKGGTISWKPVTPTIITGSISIIITERDSWTFSRYPCNQSIVALSSSYNDTQAAAPPSIICISAAAACTASLFQNISSPLYCTDFSNVYQVTTGVVYTTQSLQVSSIIDIASRGTAWASEILTNDWSLVSLMDLTPISGKINTSPVTGSIPIFQTYVNVPTVIQIIASDLDVGQTVRCRWSYQISTDECGNVCLDLPSASLSPLDCTITWTPVVRAADLASGLNHSTYVIAITAEDFINSTSTTPLSSVPHQVLVYVTSRPAGACANKPGVSGFPRRNLACYAANTNSPITYTFVGYISTSCPNDTIVEFVTSSPFYLTRSNITQFSNYTWGMTVTWTPTTNEIGLQPFCVAAVDNHGQMSTQSCVMIMVGVGLSQQQLNYPTFVQSSAAPIGTVMSTQERFSITATLPLRRTLLNNTYIRIYRTDTYAQIYYIDTKYSGDVFFLNQTMVFFVRNSSWIPGMTYCITADQGVGTADLYCGLEDGGFGCGNWVFTIWNAAASSTTTPSTTTSTATTHTVTTRFLGTTTYNTLFTTTGVPAYTTFTTTSTTSTTSTSATTSTTTTVTSTTSTTTTTTESIPDATVIYPKDMENQCVQPVAIAAAIITAVMVPLHLYAMINLFVKVNSMFQKEALQARNARHMRLRSAKYRQEEEETLV